MVRRITWLLMAALLAAPVKADYDKGLRLLERDEDRNAAEEFLKVARQGDHRAMMALGAMYAGGRGVPKDYRESLNWYKEAARYGRSDAMYRVGLIHEGGYGLRENLREAARHFLDAAKLGYIEAQFKIAMMYRDGVVFDEDPVRAYAWFSVTGHTGHGEANTELAKLAETLTPEQLVEAKLTAQEYQQLYTAPEE